MPAVQLLEPSTLFMAEISHMTSFFSLPWSWSEVKWHALKELSPSNLTIFHNSSPLELSSLQRLTDLRSLETSCYIPIILLSEELSPPAQKMFSDMELAWQCYLPFDAHEFFERISRVYELIQRKQQVIASRIQASIMSRSGKVMEALGLIDKILDDYPSRNQLIIAKIRLLEKIGDHKEMKLWHRKLVDEGFSSLEMDALNQYFKTMRRDAGSEAKSRIQAKIDNKLFLANSYLDSGRAVSAKLAFANVLQEELGEEVRKEALVSMVLAGLAMDEKVDIGAQQVDPLEIARALNKHGVKLVEKGDFATAEKIYREAIDALPDKSIEHKLWFNLGLCFKKKGDIGKALDYFEKANTSAPDNFPKATLQIKEMNDLLQLELNSDFDDGL